MNGDLLRLAARRQALEGRARIIDAIRRFFAERGFLEVETPFRIPSPIPEAHIDVIPADGAYLHPSPEVCMKRLLAAGYDRIFQMCRCWRRDERGSRHVPEFTMLEWYRAGCDYTQLMEDCVGLTVAAAAAVGKTVVFAGGRRISLDVPWERVSVREAFLNYAGVTAEEALAEDRFEELLVEKVEPNLGFERPTFLYDYPAALGSLARLKPEDQTVAERFELYIGGIEIANGFSELNDPAEQRERFAAEAVLRREMGKPVHPEPEKFLRDLAFMPEAAGIALGIDRLAMVLLERTTIDEVVAFTPEEL